MPDLVGKNIGRYHLVEQLGIGGMATVYMAFDTHLERQVAIKVIRRDAFPAEQVDRVLKRFDREAKTLAQLTHPNIVGIIDYGDFEGSPYLVMEYLSGGTLKQRLGKPVPYRAALQLMLPVAQALAFAHHKGVVHRDVKPANILITEGGQPMLTDFGIAKILEDDSGATLTGTGVGVGTPEYMAPEQGMGREIDGRADVYALGVVLYELVTGRKPYTADTPMAVIFKHLTDPLPRPKLHVPDLPDRVEQIIFKAMAKKPQDRYQSMVEFVAVLAKIDAHPLESPVAFTGSLSTLPPSAPNLADGYEDETGEATVDMGETPPARENIQGSIAPPTPQPSLDAAGFPSRRILQGLSETNENKTGKLSRGLDGGQPAVSPMPVQPTRPKDFGTPASMHRSGASSIINKAQSESAETPPQTRWKFKPWHGWVLAAVIVIILLRIITVVEPTPGAVPGTITPVFPTATTGQDTPTLQTSPSVTATIESTTTPIPFEAEFVRLLRLKDAIVYEVAYSPDGKTLAAASSLGIQFYDAGTLEKIRLIDTKSLVSSIAFSPDGRWLASGSNDKTIKLWDTESGALQQSLEGHSNGEEIVAFAPDGSKLASGSHDNTIKLWDITSCELLNSLQGHSSYVSSVSFSTDGRRLASGSYDKTIKLWDSESGALLQTLVGHHDYVTSVAFSPDGRELASGSWDNTIKLWDITSGELLNILKGHLSYVTSVAFSPDGRRLASGSADNTIRLWDVESGALLQTLEDQNGDANSVAFSPDGRRLASGSSDGTIRIWDISEK
mgnify:CR=1 FL=1